MVLNAPTANSSITLQNSLDLNGAVQTVIVNSSTATIAGQLNDNTQGFGGGLAKAGNGALILSAQNSYGGATNVNAGALYVNGSIASASLVTVSSGATLGGQGSAGAVVVNSGGIIEGGQGGVGSLSLTDLTFSGSATVNVTPAGSSSFVPRWSVSDFDGLLVGGGSNSGSNDQCRRSRASHWRVPPHPIPRRNSGRRGLRVVPIGHDSLRTTYLVRTGQ